MNLPFTFIDQEAQYKKPKKKVTFHTKVMIFPIPTRKELSEEIPFQHLWWSKNEYQRFQEEAINDLRIIFMHYPFINRRDAFQLLYQMDIKPPSISLRQPPNPFSVRITPLVNTERRITDRRSSFF
jgi:hypothetical protein